MKSPKRIAGLLVAGFLAFAPPGTMIFLSALFVRLVGWRWAAFAGVCGAVAAAALLLRRRRQGRRREPEHPDTH
jgi:membrane protein implicated in regulation of membrane protease activity